MIREMLENEDDSSSSSNSEYYTSSSENEDTDSSTEYVKRRKLTRIINFMETIESYDDSEFKDHFRLERATCNFIIDLINNQKILNNYKPGRENITSKKGFYMTLWYLANTETFRQISDRFGISKSAAHRIIAKVITFLVDESPQFIKWPNDNQTEEIKKKFQKISGIEGIIGAIDGCHIQIKKPETRHYHSYYNRNGYYSILLQGVCDSNRKFIDVFCGEAGSMHDSRLLKKSSLYDRGNSGLLGNDFVLGDSAYPSLNWLVPPFKDNGNLLPNQKRFNSLHSSARVVIEHSFGLLKARFRRLKFFENNNIMFVVKCIVAATVLHNISVSFGDEIEYEPNLNMEDSSPDEQYGDVRNGQSKREEIFNKMFM